MNANERDLVQRFVDDMTDYAIVILDVQGRVLTWNAGARELFGYASDEIVGRRFTMLHTKAEMMAFSDTFIVVGVVALLALIPAAMLSRSQRKVFRTARLRRA